MRSWVCFHVGKPVVLTGTDVVARSDHVVDLEDWVQSRMDSAQHAVEPMGHVVDRSNEGLGLEYEVQGLGLEYNVQGLGLDYTVQSQYLEQVVDRDSVAVVRLTQGLGLEQDSELEHQSHATASSYC